MACDVYHEDTDEDSDDETNEAIMYMELLEEYREQLFDDDVVCMGGGSCDVPEETIIHGYVYYLDMCQDQVDA